MSRELREFQATSWPSSSCSSSMEISCNLEKAGHSFKRSSSFWIDNSSDVFSTSSRGEDDEEALKWAALQRLPTFQRLNKGLLSTPQGHANEVDVSNLEVKDRKNLIELLVGVAEEDHENFLLRLKSRIDGVGIDIPKIEVRFQNLKIAAEAYAGSRALPTVFNYCVNIVEGLLKTPFIFFLARRSTCLSSKMLVGSLGLAE